MPAAALIDDDVVTRVLTAALRTGGDFAEVFAEDKRSSSAYLDDGKIEELSSGRDRGAGIRVVVGETTGFAHTADLSEAGLLRRRRGRGRRGPRGRGRHPHGRPHPHRGAPPRARRRSSRDVAKATKVALLERADGAARGRQRPSGRCRPATPTAAAASSSPTPTASSPATTRCARCFTVGAVALGDTGMQTGTREHRPHHRLRAVRPLRRRGAGRAAAERALTKLAPRPAPTRRAARRHRAGRRWRAVPRGVRPRPRGRPHRQGRLGVQGPRRRAGRVAARHARRRRHRRHRVGRVSARRRGHPGPAQRADPGRHPHRLHVGLPPLPQGGSAPLGQRPPAELPAPARWCA